VIILNEENYIETIKSYKRRHWQPLLDLIPVIEGTDRFESFVDSKYALFAPLPWAPVIQKFVDSAYELGLIVDFDWPKWDDGRKIAHNEDFNFDSIDVPTKCKLITAIIRNDRFYDGVLISAFESGLILKILQSINRQLNEQ
jgi:hypothetical protein